MSAGPGPELMLLGRPYCDLCEDLAAQLDTLRATLRFTYRMIDVDSAAELAERYGDRIPVLLGEGGEICTGPVTIPELEAALRRLGI